MTNWLTDHEGALRLTIFLGVFALLALWETRAPRRRLAEPKPRRWLTNWLLVVIDTVAVRLVLAAVGVAGAWDAAQQGWGLFNWLDWPFWLEMLLAILVLDLLIYAQHVLFHATPALWRIHKVHHADRDMDVTTAIRFHPLEIALSMLIKLAAIYALGAPAAAVILFEAILNGCAMFNHANIRLPRRLDRAVRWVLVTPDMHRVHHSTDRRETDTNFGFSVSWWDRLFGTYRGQPARGHDGMDVGLAEHQDARPSRLGWSLALPFFRGRR